MLKGYRTYLIAAGIAANAVLHYLGFIDDALYQTINMTLTGGGLASLRAAVKSTDK